MLKFKKIHSKNFILDSFKTSDVTTKYFNWFKLIDTLDLLYRLLKIEGNILFLLRSNMLLLQDFICSS